MLGFADEQAVDAAALVRLGKSSVNLDEHGMSSGHLSAYGKLNAIFGQIRQA
ncbi:MAG: hypothetical protein ACFNTA_05755 [Campylobacter sp.]|uniref:hypothetical protein n=1 Tax=Campylobacter sp. TaxID=205 RepID=UPI003615004C